MVRFVLVVCAILLLLVGVGPLVVAQVYVPGYIKRDGTFVQPHYRSSPNRTTEDNWSTYPNVNPYTGKTGTRRWSPPSSEPLYSPSQPPRGRSRCPYYQPRC